MGLHRDLIAGFAGLLLPLTALAAELPKVALVPVLDGLDAPIFLADPDDGTGRRMVGDQT